MSVKRQIAEALLNRLNGGIINKDSKITIRQAMFALGEARNFVIKKHIFQAYANFGSFDVPFDLIGEYEAKVYKDSRSNWCVDLPVKALDVYKGLGIYSLYERGFENESYVPLSANSVAMYSGLQSADTEGRKGYQPKGDKLYLKNVTFQDDTYKDVIIDMMIIPDSHSIGDREDFKLTPEMEFEVTDLAFQKLAPQVQVRQDNVHDNLENQ